MGGGVGMDVQLTNLQQLSYFVLEWNLCGGSSPANCLVWGSLDGFQGGRYIYLEKGDATSFFQPLHCILFAHLALMFVVGTVLDFCFQNASVLFYHRSFPLEVNEVHRFRPVYFIQHAWSTWAINYCSLSQEIDRLSHVSFLTWIIEELQLWFSRVCSCYKRQVAHIHTVCFYCPKSIKIHLHPEGEPFDVGHTTDPQTDEGTCSAFISELTHFPNSNYTEGSVPYFLVRSFCGKVCHYLVPQLNISHTRDLKPDLTHSAEPVLDCVLPMISLSLFLLCEQRLRHILRGGDYLQLTTLVCSQSLMTSLGAREALSHCAWMQLSQVNH